MCRMLGLLAATWTCVGVGVVCADSGAGTAGAPATTPKYPKVLLQEAVKAFRHITTRVASHKNWGEGVHPYPQPHVYLVAHLVEMRTAGWKDIDFATLAAVSGASALFAYEPRNFMPKYAHLLVGMDKRVAEATGFGYEWTPFRDAEEAWGLIRRTVDSGRAMKGWNAENVVFAGYQDAADKAGRKVFAMTDGPACYATWISWEDFTEWAKTVRKWNRCRLGRHTRRVRAAAGRAVALRVMRDLVTWSTQPPAACRKRFPAATFGLAGIAAYAADCANVRKYAQWSMCHGINPLWTMRHSTAVYLRRVAEGNALPAKASRHVLPAAEKYTAAYTAWHKAYGLLGHGAAGKKPTATQRREMAEAIRQALAHEKAAISDLREARAVH